MARPRSVPFLVALAIVGLYGCGMRPDAPERSADLTAPSGSVETAGSVTDTPSAAATQAQPLASPTLEPLPSIAPSPNDLLALAGSNGAPGLVHCGANFVFDIDRLQGPTGAEDGAGPEYDALRRFIRTDATLLGQDPGPDPKAREVARYDGRVAFLLDRVDAGPWGDAGGPYLYVFFDQIGDTWRWSGSGDCQPRAWGPAGYVGAGWQLDPAFRRPAPDTEVLHILVSEFQCTSGRSASGRIGPAYVVIDRYEVHVEIVVMSLQGDQLCPGVPPTPAVVRLPEPLGGRTLRDTNEHLGVGTGG